MTNLSKIFNFYKNKKVIVTGHTGFKGAWLSLILSFFGAKVYGIALKTSSKNNLYNFINHKLMKDFILDINDFNKLHKTISKIKPDIIFHLAAQPLVYESYKNPLLTFQTNMIGSLNILHSSILNKRKTKLVMITSDKCYKNNEWLWGYRENDELGGIDPYSASKACAEIAINSSVNSFINQYPKVVTVRAGNVIGGGDWSDNRIVPDIIKSWKKNNLTLIRNPNATRPWQHVLDPIFGYTMLPLYMDTKNFINGESFNFGPELDSEYRVIDVIKRLQTHLPGLNFKIKKNLKQKVHEASLLRLNCEKSKLKLKWKPKLSFEDTLSYTSDWYKYFFKFKNNKKDIERFTNSQIEKFFKID